MDTFNSIALLISLVLGVIILLGYVLFLNKNWKDKKLMKRSLLRTSLMIAIVAVPILVCKNIDPNIWGPTTSTTYSYGAERPNEYDVFSQGKDSLDYAYHFSWVMGFRNDMHNDSKWGNRPVLDFANDKECKDIFKLYQDYQFSPNPKIRDVGHLFEALHMSNMHWTEYSVQKNLNAISDKSIPYYHFVQGANYLNMHVWSEFNSAEEHLLLSIEEGLCDEESYRELAHLYYYFREDSKLEKIAYDESKSDLLPLYAKRDLFFRKLDFVNYWKEMFSYKFESWGLIGSAAAGIMLLVWIFFLRKLDVYEPEKWKHILMTFVLSLLCMQLLYPMHDFLWSVMGYYRPENPYEDLGYITISIGMTEELVKILPVLLMLKFTKAINEPVDYILYACVAGLGFAFLENIQYYHYNMLNITGRGFFCCLAHMTFSATIGYGLMLAKYRGYNKFLMFGAFYVLAAFMHGFYDFWLMDWWVHDFVWVSYVEIILLIQLLVFYFNNTLNITNFYNPSIQLKRENLKYYGILVSLVILMTGYVAIAIFHPDFGMDYLYSSVFRLMFFMFFFILSLSSMKQVRGYLQPLGWPLRGIFPQSKKYNDLTGLNVQLEISGKFKLDDTMLENIGSLNQRARLSSRIVVDDNLDAYIVKLINPIQVDGLYTNQIVLIPHWDPTRLDNKRRVLVDVYHMKSDEILGQPLVREKDLIYVGKLFSQRIEG